MHSLKDLSPLELVAFLQERPIEPVKQLVGLILKDSQDVIGLEAFDCEPTWTLEDLFRNSEFVDEEGLPELEENLEEGQDIEEFIGWVMVYPNKLNLTADQMLDFLANLFSDENLSPLILDALELSSKEF